MGKIAKRRQQEWSGETRASDETQRDLHPSHVHSASPAAHAGEATELEARQRRRRVDQADSESARSGDSDLRESDESEPRVQRERRKRGPRWVMVALTLLAGLYLAPWLVGISGIAKGLIERGAGEFNGSLRVGRVSLGWFVPPVIDAWELKDSDGQIVVQAERVALTRSLFSLALDRSDLGEIQVEGWNVDLRVLPGTTNVEQVLEPLLAQESTSPAPRFKLTATDGRLRIAKGQQGLEWTDISVSVEAPESNQWLIQLTELQGSDPRERLSVEAQIGLATPADSEETLEGTVSIRAETFPLELMGILAPRFHADWEMAGRAAIDGKLEFAVGGEQGRLQVTTLLAEGPTFASQRMLNGDRLALERLEGEGGASWQGDQWEFSQTQVRTSIGGGDLRGVLNLGDLSSLWLDPSSAELVSTGELEVGPLLAMLPNTLHLRSDVAVQQGKLSWTAHSRLEGSDRRMFVDLRTTPLVLRSAGRDVAWDAPCLASLAIGNSPSGPALEFASLQAPAVNVQGRGSLEQGELTLEADLGGLQQQLSQLVDFAGTSWAGRVGGGLQWGPGQERTADGQVARDTTAAVGMNGALVLTEMNVRSDAGLAWQDPRVDVQFGGRWDRSLSFPASLRPFWLTVIAQQDRLSMASAGSDGQSVGGQIAIEGAISRWLARLGLPANVAGHAIDGQLTARGQLDWNQDGLGINQLGYSIRDARFVGPDVRLEEPEVAGEISLSHNWKDGRTRIDQGTIAASKFSASLGQFVISSSENQEQVGGGVAVRADLKPLLSSFPAWRTSGLEMAGELEGSGQLYRTPEGHWGIEQGSKISNWSLAWLANAAAPNAAAARNSRWEERQVALSFVGKFDPNSGELAIVQGRVDGEGQQLDLAGALNLYDGTWPSDLSGSLTMRRHDWVALLRPWIGEDAQLQGTHSKPITTRGPMILGTSTSAGGSRHWPPKELQSSGAIAWDQGKLLGIEFGAGELQAKLDQQVLDLGNFRMALGDGRLQVASRISFEQPTPRLFVDRGRILEQVELTPEACRQWLMYTAPIFATATNVRGKVDVDLNDSQFPLDDPLSGSGSGTLHVRQAAIGPGPMVEQLWGIVNAIRGLGGGQAVNSRMAQWAELPEQQVSFRMDRGRVYHDRLQAKIGDLVWYTTGSVGRDQSLDLVAVIPIQDAWLANRPNLAALKGIEVRVPIRGTLTQPQVDGQVVGQLAQELARRAAGQLIDQQIQRGLGRLFGGQ